jgi:hypothetical protein
MATDGVETRLNAMCAMSIDAVQRVVVAGR